MNLLLRDLKSVPLAPQMRKLLVLVFGPVLPTQGIETALKHQTELLTRMKEMPQLMPFFRDGLAAGCMPPGNVAGFKQAYVALGLTEAGWKWLCRQPVFIVTRFAAESPTRAKAGWLNVFALTGLDWRGLHLDRTGIPLGFRFFNTYLAQTSHPAWASVLGSLRRLLLCVDAQYQQACHQPAARTAFREQDLPEVIGWAAGRILTSAAMLPSVSWQGILRKQQESVAARIKEERAKLGDVEASWNSVISHWEDASVTAEALTTVDALAAEGGTMHHCVASRYIHCVSGEARIFHLRNSHRARATLQLSRSASGWIIGEIKGPANTEANLDLRDAAHKLRIAFEQAEKAAA